MAFRVLIVDDAGFIRQILASLLSELGCHVIGEARNGAEAVTRALSLKPDLIFMDMVLPGKNGAEASQDILDALPGVRIVAMSTTDEEIVRLKAEAAGCIRFLDKPFNLNSVLEVLQTIEGYKNTRRRDKAEGE